jgi:hypothetical protein
MDRSCAYCLLSALVLCVIRDRSERLSRPVEAEEVYSPMSREGMPALLVESHAFIQKGWGGVSAQPGEGNLHFPHIFMLFTFRIYSWHRAIITDDEDNFSSSFSCN